ncbi:Death-inducer obliterator 1 [Mactra antiquata]
MSDISGNTQSTTNPKSDEHTGQTGESPIGVTSGEGHLTFPSEGTLYGGLHSLSSQAEGAESHSVAPPLNQSGLLDISEPSQKAGTDIGWNFDGMEDKNPFSGMSEEHLNKLDEVLSSVNVQELLQQSNTDFNLLNIGNTEQLPEPSTSSTRRDSSDSLPESIVSVVFSDHGYCLNPDRVGKIKPVVTQTTPPRSSNVIVAVEPSNDDVTDVNFPTSLNIDTDTPDDQYNVPSSSESPYSSPRKSSRAHTKSRYLDEDWVTTSPSKGRGRGRGNISPVNTQLGLRASTRISDQKQRDLAEKIMLANRQAMQAEKTNPTDTDQEKKSPQKTKAKEKVSQKSSGVSSQNDDDDDDDDDDDKNEDDGENDDDDDEDDDDNSESEAEDKKTSKKVKGKSGVKKVGGKYEADSDVSDKNVGKGKKKEKVKKKGKKDAAGTPTKKGKKKKMTKDKKKGQGANKGKGKSKASKDDDDESSQESAEETETKSPKRAAKKLTKKERLKKLKDMKAAKKAKLLEKRKDKAKDKKKGKTDAVTKTSPPKTSTAKSPPSKAKTPVKGKTVGAKKKIVNESPTTSPRRKAKTVEQTSPSAAVKRKISPARASKMKASTESPAKKPKLTRQQLLKSKKGNTDSEEDKPLSTVKTDNLVTKAKLVPENAGVMNRNENNIFSNFAVSMESLEKVNSGSVSDKTVKPDLVENKSTKLVDTDKDIQLPIPRMSETNIATDDRKETSNVSIETVEATDLKSSADSDVIVKSVETKSNESQTTNDSKDVITSDVGGSDKGHDRNKTHHHHHHHHHERHRSDSRDSRKDDKTKSSVAASRDRKDSQSHKEESKDSKSVRESSEGRHSKDRRESTSSRDRRSSKSSHDRDRSRRKSSESSDRDKRDSSHSQRSSSTDIKHDKNSSGGKGRRDSTQGHKDSSNVIRTTKGSIGKDSKNKIKKAKKHEEIAIDSTMIDLFKPDNLPIKMKEDNEVKAENNQDANKDSHEIMERRESKVKFLDTPPDTSVKESDIAVSAKDEVPKENIPIQPEIIKIEGIVTKSDELKEEAAEDKVEAMEVDSVNDEVNIPMDEEMKAVKVEADTDVNVKGSEKLNEIEKSVDTADIENMEIDKETNAKENTDKLDKDSAKESDDKDKERTVVDVVKEPAITPSVQKQPNKPKKPLRMSDFFSERRLKINDPKPRQKVVKQDDTVESQSESSTGRQRRNKNVAFAEILKKEKLGSDEEETSDDEFEDDEKDEDFEDPDQLYCICRQPHNQRFMICCDKCEDWFHGSCVGITKSRGAEMEKNNEEYICPNCTDSAIQDGSIVSTTTQSPDHVNKKPQDVKKSKVGDSKDVEDTSTVKPDSTVDKETPGSTKQESQKAKQVEVKTKSSTETIQVSQSKKDSKSTQKLKSSKGQTTPKSEDKGKESVSSGKKGDLLEKRKRMIQMVKGEVEQKDKPKQPYNKCFACNVRPPRRDSVYCSDECRLKHAKHNVVTGILKVTKETKKTKEKHIAVVDKLTGRTLTGEKAPTESELKSWLAEHPNYEILKSHHKLESRSVSTDKKNDDKDRSTSKSQDSSSKSDKNNGPEPVRLNVRKGLRDALTARAAKADDIMLSNSEIKSLALSIEEELFKHFKDTDSKYKAKYRSLLFNIKDQKNNGLFRKILNRKIRASKLVRMTAEELANKELAQWREQETKHTIEMIKQIETKQLNEPVHVMKKTHKGEEEVADEEGEDLSTLANEPKKPADIPKQDTSNKDEDDDGLDTTEDHGQHLFDSNCKICTGKLVPTLETTPTKSVPSSSEANIAIEKELAKSQHDLKADDVVKEVLKAIQRAKADELKEQQQSSSVTVRSPDSALSSGLDKNVKFTPIGPMLWKGFIYMQDVSKFVTTAYRVTGPADHLTLPDTITLCGRISPEHVWDYLNKVKQSATRDICVIRFIPGMNEEKAAYINLYSYLNSRSRCGVVEHRAKNIKDFYIVPLASHSKIPSVLTPFDGPGLEDNRCHMLLGVIIRNKLKDGGSSSDHSRSSSKSSKSGQSSRHSKSKSSSKHVTDTPDKSSASSTPKTSSSSSTPQLMSSTDKKSLSHDPIVKEYSHVTEQEMSIEPVGDDPLDLNAPYDPEKEVMKEVAKTKKEPAQSDAVTLMIERIAQSKNPAEATAAMVTALATSSKLGNQRKLLMELTKKVDEQKRLLEQKRISTKLGQSSTSGTSGSSKPSSSSSMGISSKDPRLRGQAAAQNDPPADAQDLDLRVPAISAATSAGSASASNTSVLPPSITPSALENSVSILSSLTSDIASNVSSTFNISSKSSSEKDSKKSIPGSSEPSTSKSSNSKTELTESSSKPKGYYMDQSDKSESSTKTGKISNSNSVKKVVKSTAKVEDSIPIVKENDPKNKPTEKKVKSDESIDDKATDNVKGKSDSEKGMQYDIVSQLMAEVSGKTSESSNKISSADNKETKDDKSGKSSDKGSTKSKVPNVTELLKNLGSGKDDKNKSNIQLPSALMNLFSQLPGSAEEPQDETVTQKIPGFFTSDNVEEDTDLRKSEDKPNNKGLLPGFDSSVTDVNQKEASRETFMGFDYDSDSSGGSFEGFDDDGTKKLSPRKRKLIQKPTEALKVKTNIFGDVDERSHGASDLDLREDDVDLRQDTDNGIKDIDERVNMALAPSMDKPRPRDESRRALPLPSGLNMSFMSSNQPPPPGEEWNPSTTMMSVGLPGIHPPNVEWSHASVPESQPPLPPLPAEPPMPKPPEPPMKKKKMDFDDGSDPENDGKSQSKNSRKKKRKRAKKVKKGSADLGDDRISQIVLEIAKKDPQKAPSVSSSLPPSMPGGLPFVPPPQGVMPPMSNLGVPMHSVPCGIPPPGCPPVPGTMPLPVSGWRNDDRVAPGLSSQSNLHPPVLPAHMQPGVIQKPPGISPIMGPSHSNFQKKPPSLLDLPTMPPPAKLLANKSETVPGPVAEESKVIVESDTSKTSGRDLMPGDGGTDRKKSESRSPSEHSDKTSKTDSRSYDRDRDARGKSDRRRSRSRDRSRRSRSTERHRRSRSGDRDSHHHRDRSRDRDRNRRRHDDWDRDSRHHRSDRSRWSRRR